MRDMSSRRNTPLIAGGASVLVVLLFAFYWFELRPMIVYNDCATGASTDARTLLKSKAEIAGNTPQGATFSQLMENNLYLRSDYESFLMKCLLSHGLQITPLRLTTAQEGEAVSDDDMVGH
jgi:hypothetical protein